MPELPDLEIFAKNLTKGIVGRKIGRVNVYVPKCLNTMADIFVSTLTGACVEEIRRDGKELFFTLSNKTAFSVHLMLRGGFTITCDGTETARHTLASLCLDDGMTLEISDPMRTCKIALNPKKPKSPDVFSEAFTFEYFQKEIKKRWQTNIKMLLINQSVMRGIGNAYSDEILFAAGISPDSFAGRIPEEKLAELYGAIRRVLTEAIESIERISPDIIRGEERGFLKIHNPAKEFTDDGDKIMVKKIGDSTTYYTIKQRLYW